MVENLAIEEVAPSVGWGIPAQDVKVAEASHGGRAQVVVMGGVQKEREDGWWENVDINNGKHLA